MEDVVVIEESVGISNSNGYGADGSYDLYAVFDGHGGKNISEMVGKIFPVILKKYIVSGNGNIGDALGKSFAHVAEIVGSVPHSKREGTTALVMVKYQNMVWVANAGDCRAILKYFDKTRYASKQITKDHKPNDADEEQRIKQSGGFISQDDFGTWRVGGNLAVSRSFGDLYLSPWVTWEPIIYSFRISSDMRAVIIASDGIWDTISNDMAVDIAEQVIRQNMSYDKHTVLDKVVETIANEAQRRGSGDNISIIFVIV